MPHTSKLLEYSTISSRSLRTQPSQQDQQNSQSAHTSNSTRWKILTKDQTHHTHTPAGTQQHRREGPPAPKTLPLDIQHPLRTRLVPLLPQVHRTIQRAMPMVPGRKRKPITYDHGMQRHATLHRSPNERTHIQGAGI